MANSLQQSSEPGKHEKRWLHIDDFSPGMYDHSWIANQSPILPVPLGACDANNTFSCMHLPDGGLGPMPGPNPIFLSNALNPAWITGYNTDPYQTPNIEHIVINEADHGGTHFQGANSFIATSTTVVGSTNIYSITSGSTGTGIFASPFPTWSSQIFSPTQPRVALFWPSACATDSHGTSGHLWGWSSNSLAVEDLINPGTTGITGHVIAYDDRILGLTANPQTNPASQLLNVNTAINFTDPPSNLNYGNQQTHFDPEHPFGFGAWGTISNGELFLINKIGGGVIINGDIDAPSSVTIMPGVQPTGNFVGRAEPSDIGLVYCSQNRGAYSWNGGNTSQKLSMQLRDDFYDCTSTTIATGNMGFFCKRWNDLMLFSNNYCFNMRTNSWWKLYPRSDQGGQTFFWYADAESGQRFYAMQPVVPDTPNGGNLFTYAFDSTTPNTNYQWKSLPIHVTQNADHYIDITRIIIRASTTGTGSAVGIQFYDPATGSLLWNNAGIPISVTTPGPAPYRFNVGTNVFSSGTIGITDIYFQIEASSSSGSAPIIHSIDIEYSVRAHLQSSN